MDQSKAQQPVEIDRKLFSALKDVERSYIAIDRSKKIIEQKSDNLPNEKQKILLDERKKRKEAALINLREQIEALAKINQINIEAICENKVKKPSRLASANVIDPDLVKKFLQESFEGQPNSPLKQLVDKYAGSSKALIAPQNGAAINGPKAAGSDGKAKLLRPQEINAQQAKSSPVAKSFQGTSSTSLHIQSPLINNRLQARKIQIPRKIKLQHNS